MDSNRFRSHTGKKFTSFNSRLLSSPSPFMADKDIWNVIFAIQNEFGIEKLPNPEGGEHGFIAKLFELRYEARCI